MLHAIMTTKPPITPKGICIVFQSAEIESLKRPPPNDEMLDYQKTGREREDPFHTKRTQSWHQQTRSANPAIKTTSLSLIYCLIISLIPSLQGTYHEHIRLRLKTILRRARNHFPSFVSGNFNSQIFISKAKCVLSGVNGCVRCPIISCCVLWRSKSWNRNIISKAAHYAHLCL